MCEQPILNVNIITTAQYIPYILCMYILWKRYAVRYSLYGHVFCNTYVIIAGSTYVGASYDTPTLWPATTVLSLSSWPSF